MNPVERKREFRSRAALEGLTLAGASHVVCGVTWEHLSYGLAGKVTLSEQVKQKFAAYLGRTVGEVFGEATAEVA